MRTVARQTSLILRNDLRQLWRRSVVGRLGAMLLGASGVAGFYGIAVAIGIGVMLLIRPHPSLAAEAIAWIGCALFMFMLVMHRAISVFFERSDFELLITSPVSPRAVLLARLTTMTIAAVLGVSLFFLPVLNGAVAAISTRYLAGYAVWLLLGGSTALAGMATTVLVVRLIGARRARTCLQILTILIGLVPYPLFQLPSYVRPETRHRVWLGVERMLAAGHLTGLARAGRGEVMPLLLLTAGFAALALAAMPVLSRLVIEGIRDAATVAGTSAPRKPPRRFARNLAWATYRKELRLIGRDPLLLARTLPSLVYLVPAVVAIGRNGLSIALAPIAIVIAGRVSLLLTAVTASGEECWDLVRMSPTPELRLRHAKMAAAVTWPLVAAVGICVIVAATGRYGIALLTLLFSAGCAVCSAWLQAAEITPARRSELVNRNFRTGSKRKSFVSATIMLMAVAGVLLAAEQHGYAATVVLVATALGWLACFTLVEARSAEFDD